MNGNNVIDEDYSRSARIIIVEGLRLTQACKAPPVLCDPSANMRSLHAEWLARLKTHLRSVLPELLNWTEQHQRILFAERPETQRFRAEFLQVFFEHDIHNYESTSFQLRDSDYRLQSRLRNLSEQVSKILTGECNNEIRQMLLQHYDSTLSGKMWQCHEAETYSFVRICLFLAQRGNRMNIEILFGPRVISFIWDLAKQLIGYRTLFSLQELGIFLLGTAEDLIFYEPSLNVNYDETMMMLLELAKQPLSKGQGIGWELWNAIVCCANSLPRRNKFYDDEIMRILIGHLIDQEADPYILLDSLRALFRMFLLDVPELELDGYTYCSISGQSVTVEEACEHISQHFSYTRAQRQRRFSTRWRIRVGNIIPKLLADFDLRLTSSFATLLTLLFCVTVNPLEAHWPVRRAQACMLTSMARGLEAEIPALLRDVQDFGWINDSLARLAQLSLFCKVFFGFVRIFTSVCSEDKLAKLQRKMRPVRDSTIHNVGLQMMDMHKSMLAKCQHALENFR